MSIAGAAATLWFLGSLRAHLQRAEGGSGRLSAVVFGAGVAWVTLNLLAQALQVGSADARSAAPEALLRTMAAVFTVANLPLAVMLLGVATITLRNRAYPGWLGWIAVVAAAAQAVLWIATVVDSGPLASDGWLTFVLYPFFLIWLVRATVLMVRGTGRLLFPMTSRDEMVQATSHTNGMGHLVLSAAAVLFIVLEMAFSAAALGGWFATSRSR